MRSLGDRPVLLLLSGGSALGVLDVVPASVLGKHLTVAMLDERWSEDPQINNFAQLRTTDFYKRAVAAGVSFFDSRPRLGEPAVALASRYEDFLRAWYMSHSGGVTVATLGMGVDGHTAGIFPGYVAALDRAGTWVAAYTLSLTTNPYSDRVTVTPHFLITQITHAVAYVVGLDKRPVLATLTSNPDTDPELLPAVLWHQVSNLVVVTDMMA